MSSPFYSLPRLKPINGRKQFARAVAEGEISETRGTDILLSVSRRHTMLPLPKSYEWQIGETVALVAITGAGMVPTSIYGLFQGFTKRNGRKAAMVAWKIFSSLVQWQFNASVPLPAFPDEI
jgi:hypothetical protein